MIRKAALVLWLTAAPLPAAVGVWTSTYPDGASIGAGQLVVDSASGLYAAPTWRGIYRSVDGAASWSSLTETLPLPFDRTGIRLLLHDPAIDALYALSHCCGSSDATVFRSLDQGASWSQVDAGIIGSVQALVVDPADSNTLWAGTAGGDLFMSTDGGTSWSAVGGATLPGDEIRSLAVDPVTPTTLYLGTGASGVFKSTDGGATWAATGAGPTRAETLLVDPAAPAILYAADSDGTTGNGIYKSTDGGASWAKLSPVLAFGGEPGRVLAFDPTNSSVLYAVEIEDLHKSTDGGATWSATTVSDDQLTTVVVDPVTPAVLYVGSHGNGVFKSNDGGATWSQANGGLRGLNFPHSAHHSLAVDAGDPARIYGGSLAGGERSVDGGATWVALGYPEGQARAIATHPGAAGTVYALHNRVWKSTDNGATWGDPSGGGFAGFTQGDLVLDPGDPQTVYAAGWNHPVADGVYKSTDGGATFAPASSGLTNPSIHCLGIDPNDGNTLYAGTVHNAGPSSGLYKTTDGGASWFQLGGGLPAEFNPNAIVVHPADSNLVYLGSETVNGGVYRSTDGGATWSKILDENVNSVAVDPGDTNRVYVGTWNTGGFYRSLDGGATWALVNSGLPVNPGIDSVVVDPADPDRILIGTTAGVYEYTFGGTITLTVTNAADSGPGSLRDALTQANQDGTPNEIRFDPAMAGASIQLLSGLPGFDAGNTTLDGDLDGDCVPDVEINGELTCCEGLQVNSASNVIRGLAINRFAFGNGIAVQGAAADGNAIECNYLGTDLSGTVALGNAYGVHLVGGATNTRVGGDPVTEGNLISANTAAGLHLLDSSGNNIEGNRVGTAANGVDPLGNGTGFQVGVPASGSVIGPDNVIAFNGGAGIYVADGVDWAYPDFAAYTGDPIQVFPLIDFDDDGGTTAFASADGITPVDSNGHTFHEGFGARFTGTLTVGAAGTYTFDLEHDDNVRLTVGGSELFEGGCCGGTSVSTALGAGGHAIRIDFAEGGGHARLRLLISGPGSADLTTDGNAGGCAGGQPGLCGELFQLRIASDFNTITRNSIHGNGSLGIDLESGNGGVTANDAGDADIGPNELLNFPEFTSVVDLGGGDYSLAGTAPPDSAVEVFAAAVDPSGHGEGREYLDTFIADPGGLFAGVVTLPPGYFAVTATATDAAGNTSEFSYRAVLQPNFLTVDNASDGGPGSLRDAIDQSNADGVTTIVDFDPGLAGATIQLLSELPALTDPETTLDGDLDDDCLPDIALDGSALGGDGLQIYSSSNLIQGLAIQGFGGDGVRIAPWAFGPADDNVLECNFVGTDLGGTVARPNGNAGISIQNQATNNRIGGPVASSRNLISGNQWAGVHLGNTAGNTVEGNYIGTDVSGAAPLGNQSEGIHIGGASGANQIGPDNVIAANQWVGVYLSDTSGTVVEGNAIGTDPSATIDLGNQGGGIYVDGATATNRFGPGNVIAFNWGVGVTVRDTLAPDWWDFSSYAPDFVDVFSPLDLSAVDECSGIENSDGLVPLDGGGGGFIEFFSARFSGTLDVDTSGDYTFEFPDLNNGVNLYIDGEEIFNNCCGTVSTSWYLDAGSHAFELHWYVYHGPARLRLDITGPGSASLGTDGNLGGCSGGQAGLCGELFQRRAYALGNTITENSIFDNWNLGIDLEVCGQWAAVTPNDPGDGDLGPNTLLNFPELTGFADLGGGSFTVDGTAPPDSRVELFAADPDPSGHGEGRDYLGFVTADPGGSFSAPVVLPAGAYAVTATATDGDGNTSEFAANLVLRAHEITVDSVADGGPGSLRAALEEADFDGADTVITFDPGLAGQTLHLLDQLPSLTEGNTTIDGDLDGDCEPDIRLDGALAGAWTGLGLHSSNNLIRGLAITRFPDGNGIYIGGQGGQPADGNVVECSYIGIELDGATPAGNGQAGLLIEGDAHDNLIGPDNVIASNNHDGIATWHSAGYPDFPGQASDYTDVFPILEFDDTSGVFASADGITPTDGGGNPFTHEFGARFTGTLNVDTGGDWTFDLPNVDDNVRIVIDGEDIIDACCGDNSVDWTLGAGDHAIEVDYWQWGPPAHLQVLISGPGSWALSTDGNTAGCATGEGGLCGEFFQEALLTPDRNRFTQNSIYANNEIGIDLNGDDVTPNDPGDGDGGPNTQLNFPELTGSADLGGGTYEISGTAPPDSTVELFGSDDDPSGHGEGRSFLGSVVADPGGGFTATVTLPVDAFAVTATATDAAGNTSEFSANLRVKSPDAVTVGSAAIFQGATGEVPIYVRDLATTPLGVDQPPGSRIQAFTIQIEYSPAASVAGISAARAGIAAALTPIFETTTSSGNTVTYLVAYDESTNPVPFTPDGAAPGDHIANLSVTIDPLAPPTPVQLAVLGSGTVLSNQGGTLEENEADGTLDVFDGSVSVRSLSATALVAFAQSSSEIQLGWVDPQGGETGFRIERSPDGSSWAPIANLGPDDTGYVDGGLGPATLYYYRVVSFSGGGDNLPSNTAAATTFPASPAKTCVTQLSQDRTWARLPAVAWNGTNWATVYLERVDSTNDELFFQFLHPDGSPAGGAVRLTHNDMMSQYPGIFWNGTNFAVVWTQHMRGPGGELTSNTFFALVDANGQILRNGVRLVDPTPLGQLNNDIVWSLVWDDGGWGFFQSEVFSEPWSDVAYWRFSEDGEKMLGPVQVTDSPDREHDIKAAWNGSEYGLAWIRESGSDYEVLFQRLLTDGTQPVGDPGPVQLWQNAPDQEAWYMDVVWNGAGWAVTWMVYDLPTDHEAIYLRLLAADGTPLGPAQRISDDFDTTFPPEWEFPVYDEVPELFAKPGGGYVVFTSSYVFASDFSYQGWEIARLEADAAGNRVGQRTAVSDFDGIQSLYQRAATNGPEYLAVYGEGRQGTMETASVLLDAAGNVINGPHDLTCCHSTGNSGWFRTAGNSVVFPFQGGFGALWTDEVPSGSWQPYGQIFDSTGTPATSIWPLSGRDVRGRPAAVAVGDTFAVAWKDGGNTIVFDRYDAAGSSLLGEPELAHDAGGPGNVALAHSGEVYGVAYYDDNQITLQRVDDSGAPAGGPIAVSDLRGGAIELRWVGSGWALVWRSNGDGNLYYALVDPWGSLIVAATPLTSTDWVQQYDLLWNGTRLGLTWLEDRDVDPPGHEYYFTELDLDGSLVYPEIQVANPHWSSWRTGLLYWKGDRFGLVRVGGDGSIHAGDGAVEDEILPGGVVVPNVRRLNNRGPVDALAFDGAALAMMWGQNRELYFQTDACLDDASPPACPDVTISSDDEAVQLAWTPVDDPESGIWRYNVYRDGFMLAEQFATSLALDDEGFRPDQVHDYEVRALNGAYLESAGCPLLAWSLVSGDANADGGLSVLDIFYLINFFFAGGPAPMGDADANGDGAVTIADIFYLINHFFAGGPPPPSLAAALAAAAPAPAAGGETAVGERPAFAAPVSLADELSLPLRSALPRALVEVPIHLCDLSGTLLGMDRPSGQRIQGLSLSVVYSPAAAVESIAFARGGLTEGLAALFETTVHSGNRISWIASFDEAASPLDFDLDCAPPGDVVARLVLRVAPAAVEGSTLTLSFDAATTVVSNQSGTLGETAANGLLLLGDGALEIIDCTTDGDVRLPHQTIDFDLVCEAGGQITAGPGLRILSPADVLLRAGAGFVFENGLEVEPILTVEEDPSLRP